MRGKQPQKSLTYKGKIFSGRPNKNLVSKKHWCRKQKAIKKKSRKTIKKCNDNNNESKQVVLCYLTFPGTLTTLGQNIIKSEMFLMICKELFMKHLTGFF